MWYSLVQPEKGKAFQRPANRQPFLLELKGEDQGNKQQGDGGKQGLKGPPLRGLERDALDDSNQEQQIDHREECGKHADGCVSE